MATKNKVLRSKSQGKARTKRATARKRGVLTSGEKEAAEGKAARDFMLRLEESLKEAAPKPMPLGKPVQDATPLPAAAFQLTGAAFDGGEDIQDEATAADLFKLAFDAPNADDSDLLKQALACISDDLELICAAASTDHGLDEVIARVAQRNHYRIKVALEVARRTAALKPEVQP